MKIYSILSKIPITRNNFSAKLFLVALPAAVLPSVFLALYILYYARTETPLLIAGLIALIVTGLWTWGMWRYFKRIANSINTTADAVGDYQKNRVINEVPYPDEDELGNLVNQLKDFLEHTDSQLTEKSDMIDLLSHDLRSPVARIMGLSNLIKLDDDPEVVEYAEFIYNEGKNLMTLLENILLMFREDSNAFEAQNVNLSSLVNESIQFFKLAAGEKRLTLTADISDDLFINVQAGLFTQALRNILGNAIKFSKEDKSIFISATRKGQEVEIAIRDEGVGMGHEDLQRIFDRFTKAGKKGTHGEASFGLGMYLSKKIIEKQGGKIMAKSEGLNKGAVFTITLFQLITKKNSKKNKAPELVANFKSK